MGKPVRPARFHSDCLRGAFLLSLFVLMARSPFVPAADNFQLPIVRQMESKYAKATSLQSHFLERYFDNGTLVRTESGTAYFRKPGKMRWEYEKPEKNLFLVDGKNAWFYTPVDHTATKIPARQSDDLRTPLAMLTDGGKLSKVCERVVPAKLPLIKEGSILNQSDTGFECIVQGASAKSTPPPDGTIPNRIFLGITEEGELSRVLVQSAGRLQTEFSFKDWEFSPSLPESLFRFSPPPGVVIVDGLLPTSPRVRQN